MKSLCSISGSLNTIDLIKIILLLFPSTTYAARVQGAPTKPRTVASLLTSFFSDVSTWPTKPKLSFGFKSFKFSIWLRVLIGLLLSGLYSQ